MKTMRTVKHQLKPLTTIQEQKFLELACAYQFEKNYFSDQLLAQSNEASLFNVHDSFITIQDKLVKNKYSSKYQLPARMWKLALKEAYDLHIRTYEAQIALIKEEINHHIYQFQLNLNKDKEKENVIENEDKDKQSHLHCLKHFLYFVTNSLFFNFQTFTKFENEFYSKRFNKARIYQRIQPIIQTLFQKALTKKDVFKNDLFSVEELDYLRDFISHINEFSKLQCKIEHNEVSLHQLLNHYCNWCVTAITKFRQFKPIQSKINPTIILDGDCYRLYSEYDSETKKNRWFLDIVSMESGKRIKGLELTGFHHAKAIMKHKKYPNLTISFDPIDMTYYVHFAFKVKSKTKTKSNKKSKSSVAGEAKHNGNSNASMITVGGDFGLTETFTFSDGWVSGEKQGKVLDHIAESTKRAIALLQSFSKTDFFGVEKNNPLGKRNHKNNCFNHNALLNNINTKYRKQQRKYNRYLENYKYLLSNEIIRHFTSDSIYGQYFHATHESHATVKLVFENLDYTGLGFDAKQKRQINLIKGILNVLEEKIKQKDLSIEIHYVNPAYTSQTCPNCYYVDRNNRDSQNGKFRCQHCGFTAIDDVKYQGLTKVVPRERLPSEDDFIAACNIAQRLSILPDSTKLHKDKIKDLMMKMHHEIECSCKMFTNLR